MECQVRNPLTMDDSLTFHVFSNDQRQPLKVFGACTKAILDEFATRHLCLKKAIGFQLCPGFRDDHRIISAWKVRRDVLAGVEDGEVFELILTQLIYL